MGGLNKRRAVIAGTSAAEGYVTILAEVSTSLDIALFIRILFQVVSHSW